jgi:hypothetical protein
MSREDRCCGANRVRWRGYATRMTPRYERSFPRGNKNEFRFDASDQTKVPITMQKRHAAKNSALLGRSIMGISAIRATGRVPMELRRADS